MGDPVLVLDVVGGPDGGRAEKVAWLVRPQEVGRLRTVYGVEGSEAAASLVADYMRRFAKAAPVVRRDLIEPLMSNAIERGAFTVPNKSNFFLGMYSHLRSLSESTAERARSADQFPANSDLDIFEGTERIQQLVILKAISGVRTQYVFPVQRGEREVREPHLLIHLLAVRLRNSSWHRRR